MRNEFGQFVDGNKVNQGRVPSEQQRRKQSEAMKGRTLTKAHKEKIRDGLKRAKKNGTAIGHRQGEPSWNKGIPCDTSHLHTPEVRKKISISNTGHVCDEKTKKKLSRIVKKWWKKPGNAKRCLVFNSPNKQEIKLNKLLNKMYPGEWKFVGNGEFIINGKCPDFININGQKKIIELYGERWHEPEEEQVRMDFFKRYGYDTLIIWVKQLGNLTMAKKMIEEFNSKQ